MPAQIYMPLLFSLLGALIACLPALAQSEAPPAVEPVVLTDAQGEYPLGSHLEILEDLGGELTIELVSSPEYDSHFVPSQVEVPNYGFTDSTYWVRFDVQNETSLTNHWLLEQGFANMQYVDLYIPLPEGQGFAAKQTGSLRPPTTRDISHPRIILSLTIPPQDQQTYSLRFQNGASMTLPLTLWTQKAFLDNALVEQIAHEAVTKAVVTVNGVVQTYTTRYTISGTTLTFVSAPASDATNNILYEVDESILA